MYLSDFLNVTIIFEYFYEINFYNWKKSHKIMILIYTHKYYYRDNKDTKLVEKVLI